MHPRWDIDRALISSTYPCMKALYSHFLELKKKKRHMSALIDDKKKELEENGSRTVSDESGEDEMLEMGSIKHSVKEPDEEIKNDAPAEDKAG